MDDESPKWTMRGFSIYLIRELEFNSMSINTHTAH